MSLSATVKKMIIIMCVSGAVFIAAGAAYYRSVEALNFALGAAVTTGFNVIKTIMLERSAIRASGMEDGNAASNYVRLQSLLRFVLTGAVLVAAVLIPFIGTWGAIAGVLTMNVAAFVVKIIGARGEKPQENS